MTVVENGQLAVEAAAAEQYDLILMDMQMPVLDGVEATRQIRTSGNHTPVIALTANVMQKHQDAFEAAGCNGFLGKPIDQKELKNIFGKYLSTSKTA